MASQAVEDDQELQDDLASGRRVEVQLSIDCLLTLQYFPELDNISLSFYTRNRPGFTIGLPTSDWPLIQTAIANFKWRGRLQ